MFTVFPHPCPKMSDHHSKGIRNGMIDDQFMRIMIALMLMMMFIIAILLSSSITILIVIMIMF